MSRQTWNEAVFAADFAGTAIASSAAETVIYPDFNIPGNYMNGGRTLHVRQFGVYSTTATPTLTFGVRWGGIGGTLLATTFASTTPSGVSNAAWCLEFDIQTRASGASGSLIVCGELRLYAAVAGTVASATGEGLVTPLVAGSGLGTPTGPAAVTVNLTTDPSPLTISAKWSASSASNTLTGHQYTIESPN